MKALPTDDDAFGNGAVRADGRGVFPAYLFQVKTPAESKGEWDLYKLVRTTPACRGAAPAEHQVQFPGRVICVCNDGTAGLSCHAGPPVNLLFDRAAATAA